MKLVCKNNSYECNGPLNDGTKYVAALTVNKEYVGQFLYAAVGTPGEYSDYGYSERVVFFCLNDEGEWEAYLPEWFE